MPQPEPESQSPFIAVTPYDGHILAVRGLSIVSIAVVAYTLFPSIDHVVFPILLLSLYGLLHITNIKASTLRSIRYASSLFVLDGVFVVYLVQELGIASLYFIHLLVLFAIQWALIINNPWAVLMGLVYMLGVIGWISFSPVVTEVASSPPLLMTALNIIMVFVYLVYALIQFKSAYLRSNADEVLSPKADAIFGVISHELRTPLNSIFIASDMLTRASDLTQTHTNWANVIRGCSRQLIFLIQNMLDYKSFASGKVKFIPYFFNLSDVLYDIEAVILPQINNKPIEFTIHLTPSVPSKIYSERSRLLQVLNNLCLNAVNNTPSGAVHLHFDYQEDRLWIRVEDTGLGMSEEVIAHIFEPFYKGNIDDPNIKSGSGLGLSITKEQVELMGGSIEIESAPTKGTTVIVTLPLTQSQPPVEKQPFPSDLSVAIFDVPANQEYWQFLFRAMGVSTVSYNRYDTPLEDASFVIVDPDSFDSHDLAHTSSQDLEFHQDQILITLGDGAIPPAMAHIHKHIRFLEKPDIEAIYACYELLSAYTERRSAIPNEGLPRMLSVLFADDHYPSRLLVQQLFQSEGHKVTVVADGLEAEKAIFSNHFDILILDHQMPEKNGLDVIRSCVQQAITLPPVILLTADVTDSLREEIQQTPAIGALLTKPILPAQLFTQMNRLLSSKSTLPSAQTTLDDLLFDHDLREKFYTDILGRIQTLHTLDSRTDISAIFETMHSLKGAALQLDAGFGEPIEVLSRAYRDGDANAIQSQLSALETQVLAHVPEEPERVVNETIPTLPEDTDYRFLLFEDTISVSHLYCTQLESLGAKVHLMESTDGVERLVAENTYSDILIDAHLWDGESGVQLAFQILQLLDVLRKPLPRVYLMSAEVDDILGHPQYQEIRTQVHILEKPLRLQSLPLSQTADTTTQATSDHAL